MRSNIGPALTQDFQRIPKGLMWGKVTLSLEGGGGLFEKKWTSFTIPCGAFGPGESSDPREPPPSVRGLGPTHVWGLSMYQTMQADVEYRTYPRMGPVHVPNYAG